MAVGLLLIRIVVGLTLALHGTQKLTRWFGGHGVSGTGAFFEQAGFRYGKAFAALAGLSELGGGVLLGTGLLTPLGVAAIVGMMLSAIVFVHLRSGFFAQNGGFEYPFVLAVAAAAIELTGPGRYSIDHVLGWHLYDWKWFVASVGVGVIATALTGLTRLGHRTTSVASGSTVEHGVAA